MAKINIYLGNQFLHRVRIKYWLNFQVDNGKPQPVKKCFSEYGNLQMATSGNGLSVGVEQQDNQIVIYNT